MYIYTHKPGKPILRTKLDIYYQLRTFWDPYKFHSPATRSILGLLVFLSPLCASNPRYSPSKQGDFVRIQGVFSIKSVISCAPVYVYIYIYIYLHIYIYICPRLSFQIPLPMQEMRHSVGKWLRNLQIKFICKTHRCYTYF